MLKDSQESRGNVAKTLITPNATRWSSDYYAFERILVLKRDVRFVLADDETGIEASMTDQYWNRIMALSAFLKPFTIAANIIQSDRAGLLDVYIQFKQLVKYCKQNHRELESFAEEMLQSIRWYWNRHIHQESAMACAEFCFFNHSSSASLFSRAARLNFWPWLDQWGSNYLLANKSILFSAHESNESITMRLQQQLNKFRSKASPFDELEICMANIISGHRNLQSLDEAFVAVDTRDEWRKLSNSARELSAVVIALLSINCSEASVERTFSAQSHTHSKNRNRLLDKHIEDEMFIKFNHRAMMNSNERQCATRIPMSDDDSDDDDDDEIEADLIVEVDENEAAMTDSSDDEDDNEADQDDPEDGDDNIDSSSSHRIARAPTPRHSWNWQELMTEDAERWCERFIVANNMRNNPKPWLPRKKNQLANQMEADASVSEFHRDFFVAHINAKLASE